MFSFTFSVRADDKCRIESADCLKMGVPDVPLAHIISNFSKLPVREGIPQNDQLGKETPPEVR